MKLKSFSLFILLAFFSLTRLSQASDCWISVRGSGVQNGTSAENAYPPDAAQKCFQQTGADGTMHVLEGKYSIQEDTFLKLDIARDEDGSAKPESYKKIIGEGQVIIEGSRSVPYQIEKRDSGNSWIRILKGASNLSIQNFQVSRIQEGVTAKEGGNSHLELKNIHFEDTRQNIVILGHPKCLRLSSCRFQPEEISHDILIENTSGLRYSKRHVRLTNGVWKVTVLNSQADAAFLDGDFAVGFDVENPSHDIEFKHCTSRNNLYSLSQYWNGDGFKAENETRNIRWKDCSAFDNADAGFDIKSDNAVMENIVALRNNRNIRSWSRKNIILKNVNASYSKHWGGIATEAGIWSQGNLDCHFCTLSNNTIQVHSENNGHPSIIRLYDSILSLNTSTHGEMLRQEKETQIEQVRTSWWEEKNTPLEPLLSEHATVQWKGGNQDFDSPVFGKTKGYHYE